MCTANKSHRYAAIWPMACLTMLVLTIPALGAAAPTTRPAVRVGTFDSRAIAVAYYRSAMHEQRINEARAEHKKAREAGDQERAGRIQAEILAEQRRAHEQVFGNGPYDSLGQRLAPVLAELAKAAGVDVIAPSVFYTAPGVERRDVSEALLDALKADAKTREVIEDLREKIRTGKYDPGEFRGEH